MTVTAAYRTQANASTEGIKAVDISDIIWHVGEPTECPLMTFIGGMLYLEGENKPQPVKGKIKSEVATQVDYKVAEKNPLARTLTVASAVTDTTTTTVVTSANTNARVGDLLKNVTQRDGEVMLVRAVDSGGANLTCERNLGSTSFHIAASDVLKIYSYGCREGGSKASLKSQLASTRTRYTQIFKRAFGITDTLKNILLETKQVDAWDEESKQALVEHKKDIEFAFWWNPYVDSATDTSGYTVNITRGLVRELKAEGRSIDCANPTEAEFFSRISEKAFEYGPKRKTLLLNARGKSKLNDFSRVKQQTKPRETAYGINVQEVETGHGIFEVVTGGPIDYMLPDDEPGYGVVTDIDRLVYKYINNRNTKFDDNTQTPGDDAHEAQWVTECGLSVRSFLHHLVLENL